MPLRLTIPGQPVSGKNHVRATLARGKGGRLIPRVRASRAVTDWYAQAVPVLVAQWGDTPTLDGPLHVTLHQYLAHDPASPASPDGDNIQSAVWDALQKSRVIANDRQIVGWAGSRQQDAAPRVEIVIRELGRAA